MICRHLCCTRCRMLVQVEGSQYDLQRLDQIMANLWRKCINGCKDAMQEEIPLDLWGKLIAAKTYVHLSVGEFVSALAGYGLPDEIDASAEVVGAMLKACSVTDFHLVQSTTHARRSILTSLTLDNGTTIHLASGPEGPTVYKITRSIHANTDPLLSTETENDPLRYSPDQLGRQGGDGCDSVTPSRVSTGTASPEASRTPRTSSGLQEEQSRRTTGGESPDGVRVQSGGDIEVQKP